MQITKAAIDEFRKMIQESGKKDASVRIEVYSSGCCGSSFNIEIVDTGKKNDEILKIDGINIFISYNARAKLGDSIIDFSGETFNIRGSQSSSCCG